MALTTDFWVSAYLARLGAAGIFAHLMHRGDATAGAVAIKVATMDGNASVFLRSYDGTGRRVWTPRCKTVIEAEADNLLARQRQFDPDLWVIEIEDPKGRHLLEEDGLD